MYHITNPGTREPIVCVRFLYGNFSIKNGDNAHSAHAQNCELVMIFVYCWTMDVVIQSLLRCC